jgi:hypothetical protein
MTQYFMEATANFRIQKMRPQKLLKRKRKVHASRRFSFAKVQMSLSISLIQPRSPMFRPGDPLRKMKSFDVMLKQPPEHQVSNPVKTGA